MANWLFKEEPDHYSYADLERDRSAIWDGVKNSLARMHLRKICRGDRIWYYHSGREKAIVGEMRAASNARDVPSPTDRGAVVVKVQPVRRLESPVALSAIKKDPRLAGWELVRLPRLSVMPVTESQWQCIEELSQKER
jgi:predicted RNA-binding protein with PUA-like domain